jgi:Flp pilus assembly protein TadG
MTARQNISSRRRRNQAGQAMLEGGLVMIVFMVMIFGLMDFGRLVWT